MYLNPFDLFVRRQLRCPAYLRYVDDFLLFGNDKTALWDWKQAIEERLAALRLTIHPGAHPRPVSEGFPFLGFVLYPQYRRLKQRKGIHFQRKLRASIQSCRRGEISLDILNARIQGWVNHVRYADTWGLRAAILGSIRL